MKILDLKLQAFGPFVKEQHIPFDKLNDKGMFLINGPTGIGKTSIFDAIVFALYGKGSGEDRADGKSMRSDYAHDEDKTYVDLTFEANGKKYRVVRYMAYYRKAKKGNGLTLESPSAELHMPDGSTISNLKSVDDTLQNIILFINRDQFKSVALLAQGEFTKLVTADSKERAGILEHIFEKQNYSYFQGKLKEQAELYEKEKDKVISSVNTLIAQIEGGEELIGYKEALEDSSNIPTLLDNIDEKIKALKDEYKSLEEEKTNAEKKYSEDHDKLISIQNSNKQIVKYNEAVNKLKELSLKKSDYNSKKEYLDKYEEYLQTNPLIGKVALLLQQKNRLNKKLEEITEKKKNLFDLKQFVEENFEKYSSNTKEIIKLNNKKETLITLNKQKQDLLKEKSSFDKDDLEFSNEVKKLNELEEQYKTVRNQFYASSSYNLAKDLKEGAPCPVCGSKIHPSLAKMTDPVSEEDFKSIENKVENFRKSIEEQRSSLDSKRAALSEKISSTIKILSENGFADINKDNVFTIDLDKEIKELIDNISSLESFISKYESSKDEFNKKNSEIKGEEDNCLKDIEANKKSLEESKNSLDKKFEENKLFKHLSVGNPFDEKTVKKVKQEVDQYNKEETALNTTINDTPEELKNATCSDVDELAELVDFSKIELDTLINDLNSLNIKINSLKKSKTDIRNKYDECKDILNRYSSTSELSKTANGINRMHLSFKMYILADYFDKIINQANRRLSKITNGRYKLVRRDNLGKGNSQQGLDLDVYDVETGKERSASSLSGGEKFVSALSMALGLSDIIETNHALIQVESIFIDEGFGSLDENYLDMAMKALETLKDDNKTVAIISHVEKLKEYIPDGLEVKKEEIGSKVIMKENS